MFTLNDILQGNSGAFRLDGVETPDPAQLFPSAQHDSRQVGRGDLFIALRGAHADGHNFIPAVARAGVGAALCAEAAPDAPPHFLQIVVPNVVEALDNTARVRAARQQHTTLIGITGSNGKTSTKDAVAAVLGSTAPTLKTFASYNNEIGYPLTLLRLEPQHCYAVLEMGAQWVGELSWLCETIARPRWSIITNVGAAHLGYFGSQERVALAKSELVQALEPQGIAILNEDDALVRAMSAKTQAHILTYGMSEGADVRGSDPQGDPLVGLSFTLSFQGARVSVQLRLPGAHGVTIALAAAAAGVAASMPLKEIRAALQELAPARGRSEIKPGAGPNGCILIDDTYNANRQSIIAITQAMHATSLAPGGKRWAVLGDIFELGTYARAEHRMSGEALPGVVDYLVAIGDEARYYVEGAIRAGMPAARIYYFDADVDNTAELATAKRAAANLLNQQAQSADLVLLKGSRGMYMETMLAMFKD